MGAIADAFNSAFRDYVTPGDPGSGRWNPDKATIRSIGALIESIGIPIGPDGAIFLDGVTTSGLALFRDDAQLALRAPMGGTPTQRHCLMLFEQPHTDDEIAIVGSHVIGGTKRQTTTWFNALSNHNANPVSFRPYSAFHGESYRGDYTPLIMYYDGAIEMGGLLTGSQVWNLGYTQPDWVHNFQNSHWQGPTVMGVHSQSVQSGNLLEVSGNAFFGAVDGTTHVSTLGVLVGWSTGGGGTGVIQATSYIPSTNPVQPLAINGATITLGQGHTRPDTDNLRDLGVSGGAWRNLFVVNAPTVTSDGRLKRVRGDGQPTDQEREWARRIKFVPYQMLEAIAEKGEDKARLHWGVIAQDVVAAAEECGIADPFAYGFLTRDPRFETVVEIVPTEMPVMVEDTHEEGRVQVVNGKATHVMVPVTRMVQKTEKMHLHVDGKPQFRPETDAERVAREGDLSPIIDPGTKRPARRKPKMVPLMVDVPITEMVDEKHEKQVPVMLDDDTQDVLLGVRYEGLYAFLRACGC